jgi:uncharacterized protein
MSEPWLLDSSALIALKILDHVHHNRCAHWLTGHGGSYATCPITQGSLARFILRASTGANQHAEEMIRALANEPKHVFMPDDIGYGQVQWRRIFGHSQATDAYLVALAAHHGGRLATLDQALATVFPEAILIDD